MEQTLHDKLVCLSKSEEYPFHMPGHKRNEVEGPFSNIMKLDITEIDGFDNLHHPEDILKQEQVFAAKLYGAKETSFLINGSTCGILASIFATTKDGEKILLSRNSHKSVYHAIYLKDLLPSYLYPQREKDRDYICGEISSQEVAIEMEKTGAKVVFITSPSYEGVMCDIYHIAKEVHKRDGILIVDEAHGAHLGFHSYFPQSAVTQGADIVIQSMHKTLPSLTQTALLHVCSERVCSSMIRQMLAIFQTSSPSYVLMASMTRCLHLLEEKGKEYFDSFAVNLNYFYEKTKSLKHIEVLNPEKMKTVWTAGFDPSKIVICLEDLCNADNSTYTGKELAKDLYEKYHIQLEMINEKYVLAMTGLYDTKEGFDRLINALESIDNSVSKRTDITKEISGSDVYGEPVCSIKEALSKEKQSILLTESVGKVSAEYIYLYPPGTPIVTPGEKITKEVLEVILRYKERGLNLLGIQDKKLLHLLVL